MSSILQMQPVMPQTVKNETVDNKNRLIKQVKTQHHYTIVKKEKPEEKSISNLKIICVLKGIKMQAKWEVLPKK